LTTICIARINASVITPVTGAAIFSSALCNTAPLRPAEITMVIDFALCDEYAWTTSITQANAVVQ